ncbi:SDR family NAD(P)-dependent oxidoreductase [Paenibacillus bovis]|uniref:Oxidoreductase n=1 Tax=Paenibacillus bovis TaxID=1616788 RepID=A0A172ZHA9_9BACL|nr:SDR family oxidoreductase [Paenibacillus bovis]ANF97025.1 oxidoreductase [Paenibacillus bovis]
MNYSQKTALVTGASSGIGEVFAHELAQKGCDLVLVARSEEKLQQIAANLQNTFSIRVTVISTDLSIIGADDYIKGEIDRLGLSVDILINNAGFGTLGRFDEIPLERIRQEMQLNMLSLTGLTQQFLGELKERREGVIVNVASLTAFQPVPYMAVYAATKAYVLSFTEALWAEYHNSGVRIMALCPGETKSSFHITSGSEHLTSKRMEPIDVVHAAFRAIDKDCSSVIAGRGNYIMAQLPRWLPRNTVVRLMKRVFQPALSAIEHNL